MIGENSLEQTIAHTLLVLSRHPTAANALVFAVAFLESFAFVGLVVPGAAFAVSAGLLASRGVYSLPPLIISGAAGAIAADLASYYLARYCGESIVRRPFMARYQTMLDQGRAFFKRHGGKSVFLGRFVGMIRPVVPFLAGLLDMQAPVFWLYAVTSGILWGIAYIGGGYLFGESWKSIESWIGWVSGVVFIGVVLSYLLRSRLLERWQALENRYPSLHRLRNRLFRP